MIRIGSSTAQDLRPFPPQRPHCPFLMCLGAHREMAPGAHKTPKVVGRLHRVRTGESSCHREGDL